MLGGNFICDHDFDMDRCPRCFRLYDRTMMYIFIDAQKTIQCVCMGKTDVFASTLQYCQVERVLVLWDLIGLIYYF